MASAYTSSLEGQLAGPHLSPLRGGLHATSSLQAPSPQTTPEELGACPRWVDLPQRTWTPQKGPMVFT